VSNQQRFNGEWETKRLGEIANCLDNVRIPLNEMQRNSMPGPYPYCGANGILDYVNDYVLDDDVVLIAEDGGYFDEFLTRPIAYRMKGKIWVNNHAHVLKAKSDYDQGLLYYSLVHKNIMPYLSGGTRAKLNKFEMYKIEINVPNDTEEQRAIAEVLSDVDGLINALDALIAKKRAIKQATMQQLLTGKTRLPGFSGKWETKRLGEISDINPQNFSSNTDPDYKFNYVTLEQVDSGKLLGYSEEVFQTAPSRAQRILRNGDVLMSTVRPNLMAHLFFQEQVSNAVCSTGFAVLRAKQDLSVPYFLFSQLFSEGVNDQIDKILSGSNYPAINSRDVKLIEISCPPHVVEQRAIGAVLSDMDTEITVLEHRRDKTIAIKQGMMQQLLTGKVRLLKSGASKGRENEN